MLQLAVQVPSLQQIRQVISLLNVCGWTGVLAGFISPPSPLIHPFPGRPPPPPPFCAFFLISTSVSPDPLEPFYPPPFPVQYRWWGEVDGCRGWSKPRGPLGRTLWEGMGGGGIPAAVQTWKPELQEGVTEDLSTAAFTWKCPCRALHSENLHLCHFVLFFKARRRVWIRRKRVKHIAVDRSIKNNKVVSQLAVSHVCLSVRSEECLCTTDRDRAARCACSARCVSVCSITSGTWQAQTLIQSGGGVSGEHRGTYGEQMIFIGLKRSSWPASLVATARVMLHYDLKMTGDAAAPKQRGEGRGEDAGEPRRCVLQPGRGHSPVWKHASIYCMFTLFDYSSSFKSRFWLIFSNIKQLVDTGVCVYLTGFMSTGGAAEQVGDFVLTLETFQHCKYYSSY